jgi:sugar phosphate isomerase/epimerase
MQINQVAAQLYTVRDFIKTPQDIAASMKKIRAIGYEAVQVSGMGPIDEAELMKILDGEGLVCCATHEPTLKILDEPQAIVERLQKLNCHYTAVPSPGGISVSTEEEVRDFVARMNRAGQVLAEHNQVLAYHNHHHEFRRIGNRAVLEIIYDESDPQYLQGEPDTYWVQYGGGSPEGWCRRLQNRLPLIHLKDYTVDSTSKPMFCEVGYGNLDWPAIIAAAEQSGCEWYIVEQDTCPGDPFDSLAMSFNYIRDKLCA